MWNMLIPKENVQDDVDPFQRLSHAFFLLSSTDLCTDGTFEDLLHLCNEKTEKKLFEKSQGYKHNYCFKIHVDLPF